MIVVGGRADEVTFADAAAYNPRTRSWRTLPPLPAAVADASVTWTGSELFVVGGARYDATGTVPTARAMAYNSHTNTWRQLPDMPMTRTRHTAVWTGNLLLVWGGQTRTPSDGAWPYSTPPNGVAYEPAADRWSPMPKAPLGGRSGAISVWTGSEMVIWGGIGVADQDVRTDGAAFRLARVPPD